MYEKWRNGRDRKLPAHVSAWHRWGEEHYSEREPEKLPPFTTRIKYQIAQITWTKYYMYKNNSKRSCQRLWKYKLEWIQTRKLQITQQKNNYTNNSILNGEVQHRKQIFFITGLFIFFHYFYFIENVSFAYNIFWL